MKQPRLACRARHWRAWAAIQFAALWDLGFVPAQPQCRWCWPSECRIHLHHLDGTCLAECTLFVTNAPPWYSCIWCILHFFFCVHHAELSLAPPASAVALSAVIASSRSLAYWFLMEMWQSMVSLSYTLFYWLLLLPINSIFLSHQTLCRLSRGRCPLEMEGHGGKPCNILDFYRTLISRKIWISTIFLVMM